MKAILTLLIIFSAAESFATTGIYRADGSMSCGVDDKTYDQQHLRAYFRTEVDCNFDVGPVELSCSEQLSEGYEKELELKEKGCLSRTEVKGEVKTQMGRTIKVLSKIVISDDCDSSAVELAKEWSCRAYHATPVAGPRRVSEPLFLP